MSLRIVLRASVHNDLHEITAYLDDKNVKVANRFIEGVLDALAGLAQMPGKGSPKPFRSSHPLPIRSWLVPGFENYVIYYVVEGNALIVLAILHGARNVRRILRDR